ncbi:MAG: DUF1648 domain-containing protein [Clostridia bacterium]|nr:DUF1648 domain-containing protein [Clostridia bacterium]
MKFIKWKSMIITSIVCLLPILLGVTLWDKLSDTMAIHFNINNEPDNFAGKGFVVFGLPILMMFLQIICCLINDINAKKHGERIKFENATKWIIPIMTIILQIVTLCYGMGFNIDIRKVTTVIVGFIFLVIGNYLPKFDYIKNYDIEAEKAKKINRFIGYETVIMGILSFITLFLPPISTVIWLILLIPYSIITIIYAIKNAR